MTSFEKTWEKIAKARKAEQEDSIPPEWRISMPPDDTFDVTSIPESCGLLTALEIEITNTIDVDLLLKKLAAGEWSSVEVTTAFYKRAIIAHQLTNCLTEIFIDRALKRAEEVDDHLKRTGRVIGPLHGLPVSLKDQFNMKGLETIMGYVSWVGNFAEHDAAIVEILIELGAVPFVRTNVPQTLMWGETFNNVFGRTLNPYNRKLTPGGSSGGEGALIALKGSPLGLGTDIGGSVRIPAGFAGLYTLRPSHARLPYEGATNSLEGQEAIFSVIGPMASDISALKTFTKAVLDANPWNKDPLVIKKPWSYEEYALRDHGEGQKLCFGLMVDNGVVRPHPPVRRALQVVVDAVKEAGHSVVDWDRLDELHLDIHTISEHIYAADGGQDFRDVVKLTDEPLLQTMSPDPALNEPYHPWDPHPNYLDEPLAMSLRNQGGALSAYELWGLHKRKRAVRKSYLDAWEATKEKTGTGRPVDGIICAVAPYAAPPHGLNSNDFYTSMWNFLDYACSAFPVTTVDPNVDVPDEPPKSFYNHEDEAVYKLYQPETFWNAPVGAQLVGRPQEEEAVICMTEIVDAAVKAYKVKHNLK